MNYDHMRHYARGWLFHFFGRETVAYAAFVDAQRVAPWDTRAARHLAAIAAGRKQWPEAEHWYAHVLALEPRDDGSWFNLGFVREQAGKATAAIDAFKAAVRLTPSLDRAWYGMGLAHARLGQHQEAAAAFREAVRLQPMNGEAYYQWGMALHHARQPDAIKAVVVKLADFEPQRARTLVQDTGRSELMALIPELPF